MNHPLIGSQAQHNIDRIALSYLEDLWVVRHSNEPRCFTIEFVSFHSRSVSWYLPET